MSVERCSKCVKMDDMATGQRRTDALSTERVVDAAIDILDTEGEKALTFRALAARLSTGAGAIYWHVADKNALLDAATHLVVSRVMRSSVDDDDGPTESLRTLALGIFDALDDHPWVGAHLLRDPRQAALAQLFDAIGGRVATLGVDERDLFDAATALVNYILGVGGQNAANARNVRDGISREAFLDEVATRWESLDPQAYPFLHRVSPQLRDHDDRAQFSTGVDLILSGITRGANKA